MRRKEVLTMNGIICVHNMNFIYISLANSILF